MRRPARDVVQGVVGAAAALVAMTGTAAAGLFLLEADRLADLGALTAAVVTLSVGGAVDLGAAPAPELPVAIQGGLNVMPLGVSLVGAIVLGLGLRPRRDTNGLLVRGVAAAAAFTAGIGGVTRLARDTVSIPLPDGEAAGSGSRGLACLEGAVPTMADLPFGVGSPVDVLEVEFSVALWPTLPFAAGSTLAVVGVCWLLARLPSAAEGLRAALWALGVIAPVCVLAAWAFGGPAAVGAVLLVLPVAVFSALPVGLGVPWTVSSTGALSCALEGIEPFARAGLLAPGGPLLWICAIALLVGGVIVAARTGRPARPGLRRAAVVAVRLAVAVGAVVSLTTFLASASVNLAVHAFGSSWPVLDAHLGANQLLTLGAALAAGATAGFVGSLLVDAFRRLRSVSWSTWNGEARR